MPSIPEVRQSIEDQMTLRYQDPLRPFLMRERDWRMLPFFFQHLVAETAAEVRQLQNPDDFLNACRDIDLETQNSPYLRNLAEKTGLLLESHANTTAMFREVSDDDGFFDILGANLTQLHLAERLIGRRIEERFGWYPAIGFGRFPEQAHTAITLCVKAVRDLPPPPKKL